MICPRCRADLIPDEESLVCIDPDCGWRPVDSEGETVAPLFTAPYLKGEPEIRDALVMWEKRS